MLQFLGLKLVDVIIKMVMDKALKANLPMIMKHVDSILPFAVEQNATPAQVKQIFADAISFETGRPAQPIEVELVERVFKPSEAAKMVFNVDRILESKEFIPVEKEKTLDQNRIEKREKIQELKELIKKENSKPPSQIDHLRIARFEHRIQKLKETLQVN